MNKSIFTFLLSAIFVLSAETIFAQVEILDTVYVTAERFSIENDMRKQAKKDIAGGKVYIDIYGLAILSVDKFELDRLTQKYGFQYRLAGCVIPLGADAYKEEVMLYLNKRNGDGWWDKFIVEYNNLERKIKSLPTK